MPQRTLVPQPRRCPPDRGGLAAGLQSGPPAQRARLSEPGRVRAAGQHDSGSAADRRRTLIILGPNYGGRSLYTASRGSIESTFALEFLTMLGIDWLLSPYDKNVFFEEIWQKRPEALATGRAGYFEGVFSKEEVERIIEFAQPRPPLIKLSSASSDDWTEVPFSPNGRIDIDQLRKLYLQGETVILRKVEDFSPAIARLARAIETEMGARVQVNSYLTPPSAQAFPAHYDTHDVLVAQIQGEKLWKVYGSDSVCPLNEMHAGDESYLGHKQPQFRPHQHQLVPDGDARNEMDDGDPQFRESVEVPEEIGIKAG